MTLLESIFPLLLLPLVVVTTHFSSIRKVSVAGITLSVQVQIQSRDMSSRHSIIAMIVQHAQKRWAPSRAHATPALQGAVSERTVAIISMNARTACTIVMLKLHVQKLMGVFPALAILGTTEMAQPVKMQINAPTVFGIRNSGHKLIRITSQWGHESVHNSRVNSIH